MIKKRRREGERSIRATGEDRIRNATGKATAMTATKATDAALTVCMVGFRQNQRETNTETMNLISSVGAYDEQTASGGREF